MHNDTIIIGAAQPGWTDCSAPVINLRRHSGLPVLIENSTYVCHQLMMLQHRADIIPDGDAWGRCAQRGGGTSLSLSIIVRVKTMKLLLNTMHCHYPRKKKNDAMPRGVMTRNGTKLSLIVSNSQPQLSIGCRRRRFRINVPFITVSQCDGWSFVVGDDCE